MTMPVSESFILACVGVISGCVGGVLTFFLRSRCSEISCCCFKCKRDVLQGEDIERGSVSIKRSNFATSSSPSN
jgi:hypothetical protein